VAEESEATLTVVGEVTREGVVFLRGGEPVEGLSGWDHFGGG
jgi:thiamine monophosphate kinase